MWDSLLLPTSDEPSLYSVLEVSILATPAEIKQQFRRLALLHHPDKAGSADRFQAIRDAFEVLKDPVARANYDKSLLHHLDIEEYLHRFSELVLTVQGLSLPLHHRHLHRASPQPMGVPQQPLPPRQQQQQPHHRCMPHPQHVRHAGGHALVRPPLLTRA